MRLCACFLFCRSIVSFSLGILFLCVLGWLLGVGLRRRIDNRHGRSVLESGRGTARNAGGSVATTSSVRLVKPLLLFFDQELRVTDNVEEQDMPDFKAEIVVRSWLGGGFRQDPDLLREGDEARVVLVGAQEGIDQQLGHTGSFVVQPCSSHSNILSGSLRSAYTSAIWLAHWSAVSSISFFRAASASARSPLAKWANASA